jgi:hypothetical protein
MCGMPLARRIRESSRPRSWFAVKGKAPDAIHGELRLKPSRVPGDDNLTFQIVGALSDAGWYLIVAEGREHRLIRDAVIQPLSAGCEIITCRDDEQNIFSAAAGWRDGRRVWAVSYDGEEAATDVVEEGDLPVTYPSIRDKYKAEAQAEDAGDALVDPMYEIPIELVHNLTGYRPRQESPAYKGRFVLLEGTDTHWLKRAIFGG